VWVGEYQGRKRRDENEEHDQAKVRRGHGARLGLPLEFLVHWRQGTARRVAISFEVQRETHERWDSMPMWREMYEEWVILQELLEWIWDSGIGSQGQARARQDREGAGSDLK
jgi:hypothetical protein